MCFYINMCSSLAPRHSYLTPAMTSVLPFSHMHKISPSGVFMKHFSQYGKTEMRSYAHRDDYYIVVLLTDGRRHWRLISGGSV